MRSRVSRFRSLFVTVAVCLLLSLSTAITEDDSVNSIKDANSSKERPRLDAYDMDETV